TAQRARAAGPAPAARRPRGAGDRERAGRLAEHGPNPYEEHLREARRDQPPGGRAARGGARTLLAAPGESPLESHRVVMPAHHIDIEAPAHRTAKSDPDPHRWRKERDGQDDTRSRRI